MPIPDGPLAVGLDGGIVRARRGTTGAKTPHLFEVIAGKSILSFRRDDPEDVPPSSKCFALVQSVDTKPKRRLFDLLHSQGMQANQQVTFFSDGGDTVRRLPEYLHPEAEHILDWFHLTMRITVLQQCARGLADRRQSSRCCGRADVWTRRLESVKHYLWHGNSADGAGRVWRTWTTIWSAGGAMTRANSNRDQTAMRRRGCSSMCGSWPPTSPTTRASIVNYGERYRNGERISTAFVESTINQVVSKRMVKKQQMQWTPEGAHLLLQVRTQVLNDDWEATFRTLVSALPAGADAGHRDARGGLRPPTF